MAMTVEELVSTAHLGLRLLSGEGGLATTIDWVHTCDLPDPWNWLGERQVLLTNGPHLPADPQGQVSFLRRLHEAGLAAVGFAEGMGSPTLTRELLDEAATLALPVFAIPYPLPFVQVAQAVADANQAENAKRVQLTARIYGLISSSDALPSLDHRFLSTLGSLIGYDIALVDRHCLHPWHASLNTPSWMQGAEPLSERGGDGVAALWRGSTQEILHSLPVRSVQDCLAFFRPREGVSHENMLLLHAAAVLSAVVGHTHLGAIQRNREAVEYVDRFLNEPEAFSDAAAQWMARIGFRGKVRGAVVAGGDATLQDQLVHRLQRHDIEVVASLRSSKMLMILKHNGKRSTQQLMDILHHTHGPKLTIGLGRRVPIEELRASLKEAMWALELGDRADPAEREAGGAVRECAAVRKYSPSQPWLNFRSPEEGAAFVDATLGPLVSEDPGVRQLLITLQVYLREKRSVSTTCAQLHLHRQTVNQRLRKIEDLLGVDLHDTETITQLWLAMRMHEATGGLVIS